MTILIGTGSNGRGKFVHYVNMTTIWSNLMIVAMIGAAVCSTWGILHISILQIADIFLVGAAALALGLFIFSGLRFTIPYWIFAPPAALLACSLIRVISPVPEFFYSERFQLAIYKPGSLVKASFWLLAILVIPLCVMACAAINKRSPSWIAYGFLVGVCISASVGISDFLGFTHVAASYGYQTITMRQAGLTAHPNTLGFVSIISVPIAIHLLASESARVKWLSTLAVALLCGGVVVSGSRAAQVLFIPVVIASIIVTPAPVRAAVRNWIAMLMAGGLIAGVIALFTVIPESTRDQLLRFGSNNSNAADSDSERGILASQALNDFFHFPVAGIGIKHIADAHSVYLQLISSGGLILLFAMLVYWIGCIRNGIALTRLGVTIAPFLTIGVIAWMMLGIVENPISDRYLYYTVACIAGLASAHLKPMTTLSTRRLSTGRVATERQPSGSSSIAPSIVTPDRSK